MDLNQIVTYVFSGIFILILYLLIFRALRYMIADSRLEGKKQSNRLPEWGLEVLQAGSADLKKGTVVPLRHGLTVGRGEANTIVLPEVHVSQDHVRFFVRDNRFVIEDLHSTNGTVLNKERMEQKTYLRIGDVIAVGSTVFRVIG